MKVITAKDRDSSETTYVRRWGKWYILNYKWLIPIKRRDKK